MKTKVSKQKGRVSISDFSLNWGNALFFCLNCRWLLKIIWILGTQNKVHCFANSLVWCFVFYAAFISCKNCPWRFAIVLLCNFCMLYARQRTKISVRTLVVPLVRNLRNPISSFNTPKAPSTCMERFVRSNIPCGVFILSSIPSRCFWNVWDNSNRFVLSSSGVLHLALCFMHCALYGHPLQPSHWYIVFSDIYPLDVLVFLMPILISFLP